MRFVPLIFVEAHFDLPLFKAAILSIDLPLPQMLVLYCIGAELTASIVQLAGLGALEKTVEKWWPTTEAEVLSKPRFIHDGALDDAQSSLRLADREQRRLLEILSRCLDAVRQGATPGPLHEAAKELLNRIKEFLEDLAALYPDRSELMDKMRSAHLKEESVLSQEERTGVLRVTSIAELAAKVLDEGAHEARVGRRSPAPHLPQQHLLPTGPGRSRSTWGGASIAEIEKSQKITFSPRRPTLSSRTCAILRSCGGRITTDVRHTILVVGGAGAADLIARLRELGHRCAAVRSGRQAVSAADELRPDLALVDLDLDGPVSGADAAARIRSDCGVPVICVLGGDADADRVREARCAAPAGYLVKPYATLQLRLSIEAALRAHRRETEFRDRSLLMESALQSASEGIVVTDQDREYVFVNTRAEQILGTVITETDPDRWHGVFGVYRLDGTTPYPIEEMPIMRAHGGQASDDLEMLIRNENRPEGVYVSASGRPLTGPAGEVTGAVVVFHDVTRLKTVESELRTTVEDLRRQVSLTKTVFDSISDALIVTDAAGDITAWNSAAERIIGTPSERSLERRSEAYGLYYSDGVTMVPPHELPTGRAIRGESTDWVDIFIRNESKPDGVHTSVSGRPLHDRSGALTGGVIVIRDVTRIRETESKLRETTAQLQAQNDTMETIFNSISDGVVVADQEGQFVMFNPSAERIVGLGATATTPDEWTDRYGIFFADKVTPVPTEELPLIRAIRGESVEQMDLFIRNQRVPDGAFISVSGRPMRDRRGKATGGVAVFRDVTRQTEADHALMEAFSQGRLEVVDTILHNIGNAITSVSIGMGTIGDDLRNNDVLSRFLALADAVEAHRDDWAAYVTADPQGRQVLPFVVALASDFRSQNERLTRTVERIAGRVSHIVDIIRTQKSFQDGAMARKVVNVRNSVMDSVKVLAESLSSRNIEVAVDTDRAPAEIWIQESRLHQMLVNLVKNALEAIDEHAASAPSGLDRPLIRIDCYREGDFLVIDVADNGIGIDDIRNRRIFSAGYTTKEGGSGLGLHSAANFVIGSGGRIAALSDGVGTGATMRVMLRYSPVPEQGA